MNHRVALIQHHTAGLRILGLNPRQIRLLQQFEGHSYLKNVMALFHRGLFPARAERFWSFQLLTGHTNLHTGDVMREGFKYLLQMDFKLQDAKALNIGF